MKLGNLHRTCGGQVRKRSRCSELTVAGRVKTPVTSCKQSAVYELHILSISEITLLVRNLITGNGVL